MLKMESNFYKNIICVTYHWKEYNEQAELNVMKVPYY